MKKNMKGITLVSLVITIIVMLILAGVSISMATGNNGVLTRGQQGALKTKLAAVQEDLNSAVLSLETDYRSEYVVESSMEAQKSKYFTVNDVGTPGNSPYINNHHGLNYYLNKSKILVGGTASAPLSSTSGMKVLGATSGATLGSIAGLSPESKNLTSAAPASGKATNAGKNITAIFLSSDQKEGVIGGDLFVALYYMENGVPVFVDVGLVESVPATGSYFKNGCGTDGGFSIQATAGAGKIVDKAGAEITGISWLNNAECANN